MHSGMGMLLVPDLIPGSLMVVPAAVVGASVVRCSGKVNSLLADGDHAAECLDMRLVGGSVLLGQLSGMGLSSAMSDAELRCMNHAPSKTIARPEDRR